MIRRFCGSITCFKFCKMDAINEGGKVLGVSELKVFQREGISALLQNRDVFVSQPTGSGKSIIFQSLGVCKQIVETGSFSHPVMYKVLVIQPVISLMLDQMDKISKVGLNVVRLVHLDEKKIAEKIDPDTIFAADIILASPEAALETYRKEMKAVAFSKNLACVAVDESHMVVKW